MQVAVAPGAARADRIELDGQAPGPVAGQAGLERGARRARIRAWLPLIRLLAQRFDDRSQRAGWHLDPLTPPVDIPRRYPKSLGLLDQLPVGHALHDVRGCSRHAYFGRARAHSADRI